MADISTQIFHPNARSLFYIWNRRGLLLGQKKEGFAKGLWLGPGGTVEVGESPLATAMRESYEEVGIVPRQPHHVANLQFTFANYPRMYAYIFTARSFKGLPIATEEMGRPKWFPLSKIPYELMWEDDRHWLPHVLAGKFVIGKFTFNNQDQIIHHHIRTFRLSK